MPASKGKGGNIETRRNPFHNGPKAVSMRPKLNQVSDLSQALELCIENGCAVMLGATRDGGAVVFTILDGDDRHRTYCSNDAEFQDAIDAIIKMYDVP